MAWFKMDLELLNSVVAREIKRRSSDRESHGGTRRDLFIEFLARTVNGLNDIQDSYDMARVLSASERQSEIVWCVLIKHSVLRKSEKGYSAMEWMIENGLVGVGNPTSESGSKEDKRRSVLRRNWTVAKGIIAGHDD
jgi:hypothetical protein